ncbi:MAG: ATP-dependent zinc metalloprotease FtsH [Prolixibacteraceae bacterium]|nr:ATP-dependent zinc metalloprotease FtsH [Prolixibacteraceae bacterium]MBN2648397.1 ATP-dependent zinc metalloprotease FtsH [Prolixibacteraceae bacterium]
MTDTKTQEKKQKEKSGAQKGKGNFSDNFKPRSPQNKDGKPKFNMLYIYLAIMIILGVNFFTSGKTTVDTNWLEVKKTIIRNGDVEKILVLNGKQVNIYLKKESYPKYKEKLGSGFSSPDINGPHFSFKIQSVEVFESNVKEALEEYGVEEFTILYDDTTDWSGVLSFLFPVALLIFFWWFIFRRMSKGAAGPGGGIFNVGKSQAKLFDKDQKVTTSFKDVAGLAEAKQEIEEIVSFLKNPDRYTKLGGKIPKGALLVGPPGTGKTLLARAVAGEAHVPFFSMSGSDFVEMFVGVGASRVRDLFKQAKEKSPCIVFIDEIDAIGRARGKNPNMGSNDERENTLNQLLTEMDGFDTNSGVIILAATNRADILDRALMRAGRFDRQIHVELPDLNERKEIFDVHLKPLTISKNVDVDFLSKQTPGFSGADIANVCNESALIAARREHSAVEKQDFLDAVDRIIGGLEKKNKIISAQEKKTIAYHEAGHATVSWLLKHAHPLVKVTIVPRGKALGAAWYLPEERSITTKEQMMDEMSATLGGRAAEEVTFGSISSGAQNDLERVTKQAYAMVCYFGMSEKVGNLSFYDSSGQSDYSFTKPYSEKTAELIDDEIKSLIEQAYIQAKKVLGENKEGHKILAERLLEKEVLFTEDLEQIFGKRPGHESDSKHLGPEELKEMKEQ